MSRKKSASQHQRHGTHRADRHGTDKVPIGTPTPCRTLSAAAQAYFDDLVQLLLPQKLCSAVDGPVLTMFAESFELYDLAMETIQREGMIAISAKNLPYQHPAVGARNKAWEQIVKLSRRFGMTPIDRTGLDCGADPQEDAFDELFRRSQD